MAIMTFAAGFLVFLLPETNGRPLPSSVAEVEAWSKSDLDKKNNNTSKPDPPTQEEPSTGVVNPAFSAEHNGVNAAEIAVNVDTKPADIQTPFKWSRRKTDFL